ncbi:MAG: hypothetical protein J1E60_04475 [Christensenellaceae bacterium]|nr:hypothetical protein [Christensenellaceae bacterium]
MKGVFKITTIILVLCCVLFPKPLSTVYASGSTPPSNQPSSFEEKLLQDDNVKLLRDSTITVCTFAIGVFAIIFQLGPTRDKHGHSYRQEDHFEMLYTKDRMNSIGKKGKKTIERRSRTLPKYFFTLYTMYFLFTFFSILSFYVHKCCYPTIGAIALLVLWVGALVVSCCFVCKALRIVYVPRWLIKSANRICKKANKWIEKGASASRNKVVYYVANRLECCRIVANVFRILAGNEKTRYTDIQNAYELFTSDSRNSSVKRFLQAAVEDATRDVFESYEPQVTCLISIIASYCIAGFDRIDGVLLDNVFYDTHGSSGVHMESASTYAVIWVCALREIGNEIERVKSREKEVTTLTDHEKLDNLKGNKDILYGWLYNKIEDYSDALLPLYRKYVLKRCEKSELNLKDEETRLFYNIVCQKINKLANGMLGIN